MTAGIRATIEELTGSPVDTCPWRAFFDPFVQRVEREVSLLDAGVNMLGPDSSHRLVEGIAHYVSVKKVVDARMRALAAQERAGVH